MATTRGSRRGWRERIEPGLYRSHRLSCPSSHDERPGRRCRCPWQIVVPGAAPGTTRLQTIEGSVVDARARRRTLQASGRPSQPRAGGHPRRVRAGLLHGQGAGPGAGHDPQPRRGLLRADRAGARRAAPDRDHPRARRALAGGARPASLEPAHGRPDRRAPSGSSSAPPLEWERIPSNPASRLTLPAPETETEQAVERVLDAKQLQMLFAAAGTLRTETMLRVAGEAGLRRGEIAGLKWPDVDLPGRRLSVRRSIVQERASADSPMRKIERTTKGRRARKVAITKALAARLGELVRDRGRHRRRDCRRVRVARSGRRSDARPLTRTCPRACADACRPGCGTRGTVGQRRW